MHIVKPGLVYFLVVFGAGFALAFVRIPFLIPAFGVRTAELMEIPVMLLIITWASLRIFRRQSSPDRPARLVSGVFAFVLLVAAELLVAFFSWRALAWRIHRLQRSGLGQRIPAFADLVCGGSCPVECTLRT